jgi:hypothetical protein
MYAHAIYLKLTLTASFTFIFYYIWYFFVLRQIFLCIPDLTENQYVDEVGFEITIQAPTSSRVL